MKREVLKSGTNFADYGDKLVLNITPCRLHTLSIFLKENDIRQKPVKEYIYLCNSVAQYAENQ